MTSKSILKDLLLREQIVKIKKPGEELFKLKSGKLSRLFIDIKQSSLNPIILNSIVNSIINEDYAPALLGICARSGTYRDQYNQNYCIGSVAVGGVPIGTSLSTRTGINQIIVRSEKHDRGTETQVIGNCKNKTIILIEDVATSGGSIVKATQSIREAGGVCNSCVAIVDREEGAKLLCFQNNINLIPILKKSDFGLKE